MSDPPDACQAGHSNASKHTTLAEGKGREREDVPCVDLHLLSGLSASCLEVLDTVVGTSLDEHSEKKRANLCRIKDPKEGGRRDCK